MPKLPRLSGIDVVKALSFAGFVVSRQRGSHVFLKRGKVSVSVPLHLELQTGTLRAIIRQSGLSVDEFRQLL
jgi:predicted RNA binding protein YcfA (HicA-like mRNA interferase family)